VTIEDRKKMEKYMARMLLALDLDWKIQHEDDWVILDSMIYIEACKVERECLTGTVEIDGFLVSIPVVQHIPGECDDVDIYEVSRHERYQDAVNAAIRTNFESMVRGAAERVQWQYAEEEYNDNGRC